MMVCGERTMSAPTIIGKKRSTIADLAREPGKAELVDGRIIRFMPTGHTPSQVAFRIARKLADHVDAIGRGYVYTDGMGFTVPELTSGRESFCPDMAYYDGPLPGNRMKFVANPPKFAVEVRSENDYGPAAEREMAAKRADYFEAGTQVVWDVDPVAKRIHSYRIAEPESPIEFGPGSNADAEPALPGWVISVDWIMS
jgi:Uma2 family endonuclease